MYDDDEELDEDEGQVTGLMNAAAIHDEEDDEMGDGGVDVRHPHG